MPGSRWNCSMSRTRGSGRDKRSEAGNLQATEHAGHRLPELLVDLAVRVVDGSDDQILKHLDFLLRDDLGINGDGLHLLGAVDDDGHHPAAGRRLDPQVGHLLLQAFLHLFRLLHHGCDVHGSISSTSRISAGNTSSTAWIADEFMASALRSRLSVPPPESALGAVSAADPAAAAAPWVDSTITRRPTTRSAVVSTHARDCSNCSRSARCVGENTNVTRSPEVSIFCACATTVL